MRNCEEFSADCGNIRKDNNWFTKCLDFGWLDYYVGKGWFL